MLVAVAAIVLVVTLAVSVAWVVRPRDALNTSMQQIISSADVSDTFSISRGWGSADVTSPACRIASIGQLDRLGGAEKRPGLGPLAADPLHWTTWVISRNQSIFEDCYRQSRRYLYISFSKAGECRAIVVPSPTCEL